MSTRLAGSRHAGSPTPHDCSRITLLLPQFQIPLPSARQKETAMKKLIVAAGLATTLMSFEAQAQDRGGSAVLGAVSGLVVFGPVGAAAGALVGYTAGPAIAQSWGIGQRPPRSKARRAARANPEAKRPAATANAAQPSVARSAPQAAAAPAAQAPAAPAPAAIASTKAAPPIQTFE
jgi:hypothetical protein